MPVVVGVADIGIDEQRTKGMDSAKYEDGHCPKCRGKRADIVCQHEDRYEDADFS